MSIDYRWRPILMAVLGAMWILSIPLGIWAAKKRSKSPHWMWFGLHPVAGWMACLVLLYPIFVDKFFVEKDRGRPSLGAYALLVMSAGFFILSLFRPALLFDQFDPLSGFTILLWGWLGPFTGTVAWYANPIFIMGLVFLFAGYPRRAQILNSIACCIAMTSPFASHWWFSEAEATPIKALGQAYYLWLASIFLATAASAITLYRFRRA